MDVVSVNVTRAQIHSPGQRVVDILSRGFTQPKTAVSWSSVNRTENDKNTIPQTFFY